MTFRLPTPALVAAILAAITVFTALGIWQLQRNEWKQGLVRERNERTADLPLTVAAASQLPTDDLDYRRLSGKGSWDWEHPLVIGNRARLQTRGEELVLPFLLAAGGPALLVNRGWYPLGEREGVLAELAERPDEPLSGLIRAEVRSGRQTSSGIWTALDPGAMSRVLPYPVLDWVVVEGALRPQGTQGRSETLPLTGYPPYSSTTPHLEYAATWFGIAVVLMVVAVVRFVIAPRRTRPPADSGG